MCDSGTFSPSRLRFRTQGQPPPRQFGQEIIEQLGGKPKGAKAVLEVRSLDIPFILEDGQIVGRLVYDRLTDIPDQLYGERIGSHYQAQGLKLSKHFKQE